MLHALDLRVYVHINTCARMYVFYGFRCELYIYIYTHTYVPRSFCLSVHPAHARIAMCTCIGLRSVFPSACLSACLSFTLSLHLPIYLSTYLYAYLHIFLHLSNYLPIFPSIYLFVYVFAHLSIYHRALSLTDTFSGSLSMFWAFLGWAGGGAPLGPRGGPSNITERLKPWTLRDVTTRLS